MKSFLIFMAMFSMVISPFVYYLTSSFWWAILSFGCGIVLAWLATFFEFPRKG